VKLVADENIDTEIIIGLRNKGYEVSSIAEDFSGIPDDDVLKIANERNATLITGDKDFGELVFRRGQTNKGVILIRIFGIPQEEKTHMVLEAFAQHAEDFPENFTVIGRNKIRIKSMI
jgi:predicted nuclease of predicted toxin-antitoxin system